MQTIKTAVVVVLLLGVCYGAYVALNAPEPVLPPELESWSSETGGLDLAIEEGAAVSIDIPQLASKPSGELSSMPSPDLSTLKAPEPSMPSSDNALGESSSLSLPPPGALLPGAEVDKPTAGQLASVAMKNGNTGTPELPQLDLPPGMEGTSVPLPGLGATALSPNTLSSAPASKAADTTNSLSSLPGMSLPHLPGNSLASAGASESKLNASGLPSGGSPSSDAAAAGTQAGAQADKSAKPTQPYKAAREEALKLASDGKLREALSKMSVYYNHIELTREEQLDLIDLLDALAAEVIYSKRHLLESPFTVTAGETLEGIANRFHVSPEVLANINLMGDSKVVLAGTQLKVLNGPFRADVNLTRGELTLFLGDLYAGRFPISIGADPAPSEGTYQIMDRRRDRTYYGTNSQILPATDPHNPYGGYWMSLGQDLCIHGSPAVASPELANAGCISLAPLDAREVYSLLTHGSQVHIHR